MEHQRIFDGHNDVLLRLWRTDRSGGSFFQEGTSGHIDLPRARRGGLAGGIFAMFVPPTYDRSAEGARPPRDRNAPARLAQVSQTDALAATLGQLAIAQRIERGSHGEVDICRTARAASDAMEAGRFAMVLHLEGAEAIDPDFEALEVLYAAGVRSLGPVWSRPTIFGTGVPFRFPSSPDLGEGLTDHGLALIRACNDLGIMIDVSHMNERSFWDVARVSRHPLVATHSNAHAVCPVSRNLTDAQMDAIRDSEGVVGLNFANFFLRPDGRQDRNTPLAMMTRHLDHMLAKLGPAGVALGSDFDGASVPDAIGDVAGLPRLVEAMEAAGYGADLMARITHRNWLSVLSRTLH